MSRVLAGALVFAIGLSLNCSSGSAGGPGGAQMSWLEDGMSVTPFGADATLTSSSGVDSLRIDGLTQGAAGSVTIILGAASPFAPQTFDCNQLAGGQTVTISRANGTGFDITDQSCKVVVTQVGKVGGPSLMGTFEAVISLTPSGTKTLSNGVFNIPVQM
jgi:hypothetical protein